MDLRLVRTCVIRMRLRSGVVGFFTHAKKRKELENSLSHCIYAARLKEPLHTFVLTSPYFNCRKYLLHVLKKYPFKTFDDAVNEERTEGTNAMIKFS